MNALLFSSLAVPKDETVEKLIAIMGPTGAGKSSFIHNSAPPGLATNIKVGHSLQSETYQVEAVTWDAADGTRVKLVDTPGFDDSREGVTDAEVLNMIATFLAKEYGKKSQLTGLIYVHRISDPRVGGASRRNLRLFRKLCGTGSLKNVVIVTSMWDKVTAEEGLRREQELKTTKNLFKPLLDGGAIMMRHDRTVESANKVISHLLEKSVVNAQIVQELVEEKKTLETTEAGGELHSDIDELMKKHKEEMELLKAEMKGMAKKEVAEEKQKMNHKMAKLMTELDELKRGITVPITAAPPDYDSTGDFLTPEPTCVVRYAELLRLIQMQRSVLTRPHRELCISVANKAAHFADALETSVNSVQHGLSTLSPESVHSFQQFMKADPQPRSFTYSIWTRARYDMEIAANEVKIILPSKKSRLWVFNVVRNGQRKRADALNAILSSLEDVINHLETMVKWWIIVIDALAKVEDAAHRMEANTGLGDAVKTTLTRIIRALGSYCDTYAKCPADIRQAASGLTANF